ncbi:MAG: transketolase C-terminal domain-containing protein, partial [Mucilaginibacter sp.]
TQELLDQWHIKCPVRNFEKYLLQEILSLEWVSYLKSEFTVKIDEEVKRAVEEPSPQNNVQNELADVYKPYTLPAFNYKGKPVIKRYAEAIHDGLALCMEKYDNLILFDSYTTYPTNEGTITEGLSVKYGTARVKNVPDCESGIVGTAIGLALNGYKAIVELQFGHFMGSGFNQIVNNIAKSQYRRGQNVDVVLRIPVGINSNGFQTDVTEAWFTKTPGLKVVYPAFPADAKGLLMAVVDDPNPVVFFEHQHLYQNLTGEVPEGNWFTEIGKARVVKEGTWATIITYGMGVHWALEYVTNHPQYSIEVIDLRTLQPWDKDAVEKSVAKTSRAMILHEDTLTGGFGGEIAAHIAQHCFTKLDAPIMRCASLDTPVPMHKHLQEQFLAKSKLEGLMEELLRF